MDAGDEKGKELMDLMMVFPRRIIAVNRAIVSKYLRDTRIKPYHLMIVKGIGDSDGLSQKDLGQTVPFDKSYISVGVHELIDMGFVVNSSEGRVHRLTLTESGRDLRAMADMLFDITGSSVMSILSPEELDELIRIMHKIDDHSKEILESYSRKDS